MSTSGALPRGAAKYPIRKQKVAVFGGGGYLGAITFGFLQRASSLYGTGLGGGGASPRMICATAASSNAMNRILSKHFVLAFAGENMMRLTDMKDVSMIQQRLQGYSALVIGTEYYLETRPVTANTYETTNPNSKTTEFYLDAGMARPSTESHLVSPEIQLTLFQNTLKACKAANVKHVIVMETPQTKDEYAKQYAQLLDETNVPFTYIRVCGDLANFPDYTYAKGVQGDLNLESFTFSANYNKVDGYVKASWMDDLGGDDATSSAKGGRVVYREDVAALAVQCLQSLDWSTSRCIVVSSAGPLAEAPSVLKGRHDKEWCVNSHILADKLAVVQ
jgi:hypothetical protein